jgi:hypothetical protein
MRTWILLQLAGLYFEEDAFLAGGLMGQKSGFGGNGSIKRSNNVHCSQAVRDVDVEPVVANLDFVEAGMVTVGFRRHAAVQSGFNFR